MVIGAIEILLLWFHYKARSIQKNCIWTEEATRMDISRAMWSRFKYRTDRYEPLQMIGRGVLFGGASTAIGLLLYFGAASVFGF